MGFLDTFTGFNIDEANKAVENFSKMTVTVRAFFGDEKTGGSRVNQTMNNFNEATKTATNTLDKVNSTILPNLETTINAVADIVTEIPNHIRNIKENIDTITSEIAKDTQKFKNFACKTINQAQDKFTEVSDSVTATATHLTEQTKDLSNTFGEVKGASEQIKTAIPVFIQTATSLQADVKEVKEDFKAAATHLTEQTKDLSNTFGEVKGVSEEIKTAIPVFIQTATSVQADVKEATEDFKAATIKAKKTLDKVDTALDNATETLDKIDTALDQTIPTVTKTANTATNLMNQAQHGLLGGLFFGTIGAFTGLGATPMFLLGGLVGAILGDFQAHKQGNLPTQKSTPPTADGTGTSTDIIKEYCRFRWDTLFGNSLKTPTAS
jgi:ABC-type transporter Mla subunit MlaD